MSPILFIAIAFIAARFASVRVFQKLISKNEHSPTPSHPRNIVKKFPAVINIIIKNVKRDKYAINWILCLSLYI